MEIRSGTDAARIGDDVNLNGQFCLLAISPRIASFPSMFPEPHLVYLRLVEGSRTSIAPLFHSSLKGSPSNEIDPFHTIGHRAGGFGSGHHAIARSSSERSSKSPVRQARQIRSSLPIC